MDIWVTLHVVSISIPFYTYFYNKIICLVIVATVSGVSLSSVVFRFRLCGFSFCIFYPSLWSDIYLYLIVLREFSVRFNQPLEYSVNVTIVTSFVIGFGFDSSIFRSRRWSGETNNVSIGSGTFHPSMNIEPFLVAAVATLSIVCVRLPFFGFKSIQNTQSFG